MICANDGRLIGKLLLGSAAFGAAYPLLRGLSFSARALSDGFSIAGIALLIAGLFRLVNHMGLFDSTKFGWKKFAELYRKEPLQASPYPTLADYKQKNPYQKTYLPFLIAAALDVLLAVLLA